jgi:hypothetical protein
MLNTRKKTNANRLNFNEKLEMIELLIDLLRTLSEMGFTLKRMRSIAKQQREAAEMKESQGRSR